MIILLTASSFLSGSLMFSYWLGLMKDKNLKVVGDGNPGALNLWKASGYKYGIAGIILDFLKGYLPLIFLIGSDYAQGYYLVPLAIAPIAGHAFTPFLKGKGGKAIAVTFGVWSAISGFEVSLAYAFILALMTALSRMIRQNRPKSREEDGVQVVSGMLLLSIYLYIRMFSAAILLIWLGNFIILVYKHRLDVSARLKKKLNKGT